ncbi:MAG: hypothetical protein MJ075_00465 [Oscillospiraceae bacterium]|nr:hypothetical protein [Oscillospiraceae bacterium]
MILTIYKKAMAVLVKKPFALWGISLLCLFLSGMAYTLFGVIPGLALAIGWLLETSMTLIYLHGYRGHEVKVLQLFDCFRDWATIKRVLCGMGWMTLWILLWGLIPFVGPIFAIIRVYRYRLTPYILMQEPEVAPTEAVKLSQQRTNGWKGKMFGADILVYVILCVIILILSLLAGIPYIGILFGIIDFFAILICAALAPLFLGLVNAAFYEEIKAAANSSISCPNCGNYVHIQNAYCQHCGAPLKAAATPAEPTAPGETAVPTSEAATESADAATAPLPAEASEDALAQAFAEAEQALSEAASAPDTEEI